MNLCEYHSLYLCQNFLSPCFYSLYVIYFQLADHLLSFQKIQNHHRLNKTQLFTMTFYLPKMILLLLYHPLNFSISSLPFLVWAVLSLVFSFWLPLWPFVFYSLQSSSELSVNLPSISNFCLQDQKRTFESSAILSISIELSFQLSFLLVKAPLKFQRAIFHLQKPQSLQLL